MKQSQGIEYAIRTKKYDASVVRVHTESAPILRGSTFAMELRNKHALTTLRNQGNSWCFILLPFVALVHGTIHGHKAEGNPIERGINRGVRNDLSSFYSFI